MTFHAFVDPTDGGGTVTFAAEGETIPGCANLPFISGGAADWEAECTTSSLPMPPVGSDWITATYSGDSAFAGSSGLVAEFISKDTTSTALTASPSDIEPDGKVALTASVSGGDGGGSVAFTVDGTALPGCGDVPLTASGTAYEATCTASWPLPFGYQAVATYSGDSVTDGSSGSAEVSVLPPAATTTSLSLSPAGAVYGQEQAEKVSATVSSPGGTPAGIVTVISDSGTVCTITLASGSGTCTLTAAEFPPGTVPLSGGYDGSPDFLTSSGPVVTLTVSKAATTTGLTVSPAGVAYGHEQAGRVSVAVTSPGGTPGGTVTVKSGTVTVCTITLASGEGSCTLPAAEFPPGTAQLTASYNGSADFATSTSAAKTLTVSKATTKTALSLSATKVTYGHEQAERLTASVAPQYSGTTPGGTVTVKSGTTTVCTITLGSGKGSCTLSTAKLPAATQHLTATYNGSADFNTSASAAETLAVSKATSKTALSLSATKVTYGHEQAERLTASVAPQYSGTTPGGTVTVKSGTTTVCTITLGSGKGSCTLSAKKLPTGAHTLSASYSGSSDFTSSTSARKTLTVAK